MKDAQLLKETPSLVTFIFSWRCRKY